MPLIEGNEYSPDDAVAHGYCPETGIDLKGVNIEDHIGRLWPRGDCGNPEIRRRIELLRSHAKKQQPVELSAEAETEKK